MKTLLTRKADISTMLLLGALLLSSCQGGDGNGESSAPPSTAQNPTGTADAPPATEPVYEPVPVPPLGFSPSVDKESIVVGGSVDCVAATKSPDGAELAYTFSWFESDKPRGEFKVVPGAMGSRFVADSSVAHKWVRCVVSAKDPRGLATQSDPSPLVAIANSGPVDFTPSVSLDVAFVGDSISCTSTTSDPDGDDVSFKYHWEASVEAVSGEVLEGNDLWEGLVGFDDKPLVPSIALIGRSVRCLSDASDSLARSHVGVSGSITIANQSPALFLAQVSAAKPKVGETISCSGSSVDPDGGGLTYSFAWLSATDEEATYVKIDKQTSSAFVVTSVAAHKFLRCEISAADANGGLTTSLQQGLVEVENSAPAAFASHVSAEDVKVGDTIECRSLSKDGDEDQILYAYKWYRSDSEDGEFDEIPGEIFRTLSIGPSLTRSWARCRTVATDVVGAVTESSLSQKARVRNTAPEFFLTDISAATSLVGSTLTCLGTTTDVDENALAYRNRWLSSRFETGPFLPLGETSDSLLITPSLAHRFIQCQRTADDTYGGVVVGQESGVSAVLNTAPEAFDAFLAPSELVVGDSFSCTGATTDKDDDAISYSYVWMKGPEATGPFVDIAGELSGSLSVDARLAHSFVRCAVIADDSFGGVTRSLDSAVSAVLNTKPTDFDSGINDRPVRVGADAVCSGASTDVDLDTLTPTYLWQISDFEIGPFFPIDSETLETLSIVPSYSRKYVRCQKTESDGWGGSTTASFSPTLAVLNSAPAPFAATTTPPKLRVSQSAACSGVTTDADLDSIAYSYQWFRAGEVDGVYLPLDAGVAPSFSVAPEHAHGFLKCQIQAADAYGGVADSELSSSVEVENTAPADFSVSTSTSTITMGLSSSCIGETTDADLDVLTPTYEWYVAGDIAGPFARNYGVDTEYFTATPSVAHKYLRCVKRLNDGHGGEAVSPESSVVTVANLPPFAFTASLSPATGVVNEELTCSGSTSDPDNDDVTTSGYQWFSATTSDGAYAAISGANAEKLKLTSAVAHNYFKCTMTVEDGWGGSTTSLFSNSAFYVNTPPDIFSAATNGVSQVAVSGLVQCTATTSDVDDDELTYSHQWYISTTVNGTFSAIPGASGSSYTVPAAYAHQYLRCERIANDGFGGSTTSFQSGSVSVINTAPDFTNPGARTVAENAILTFTTVGFSDIDSDSATWTCPSCPEGASVDSSTGAFSYSPGYLDDVTRSAPSKNYSVTIRVSDGYGGTKDQSFSVAVTNTDRAPSIAVTCPSNPYEDATMYFPYEISDPDGDALVVSKTNGFSDGPFSNESAYSRMKVPGDNDYVAHTGAKPNPTWSRAETVYFKVAYNDSYGDKREATASCSFTMYDVNRPMTLDSVSCPTDPNEDVTHYVYFSATDPDGDTFSSASASGFIGQPYGQYWNSSQGQYYFYEYGSSLYVPHSGTYAYGSSWRRSSTVTISVTENGNPGNTKTKSCAFTMYDVDQSPTITWTYNDVSCQDRTYPSYASIPYAHYCESKSMPAKSYSDPDGDSVTSIVYDHRQCGTRRGQCDAWATGNSAGKSYALPGYHRQPYRVYAHGKWSSTGYGYKNNCYMAMYLSGPTDFDEAYSVICAKNAYYWNYSDWSW